MKPFWGLCLQHWLFYSRSTDGHLQQNWKHFKLLLFCILGPFGPFWILLDPCGSLRTLVDLFGPLWTLVDPFGPSWTLWRPMEYLLRHFGVFLNQCVLQQFSNKAPASPPVVVIMSRSNNADKTPLSFWKILRPFFKGTMMTSYLTAEQIPFWPFFPTKNQGQENGI